jgi:hypothetical protein
MIYIAFPPQAGDSAITMRLVISLIYILAVAVPAAAQRRPVGIFTYWGAFEDAKPRKCFAIAKPENLPGAQGRQPYASVGFWPERSVRYQLHFRLSHKRRPESAIFLRIDRQSFQLRAGGDSAWAPNARADAAIVAAMRTGFIMTVEMRTERGILVRDRYPLRGAASAIDAAAIACARN